MGSITREVKSAGVRYRAKVRIQDPEGRMVTRTKRFSTRKEALAWSARKETEIRDGEVPEAPHLRWADLVEAYLGHPEGLARIKNEKDRRNRRANLEWWLSRLGKRTIKGTPPGVIDSALVALRKCGPGGEPASGSTANRYLSHLSAAYRFGERRYGLRRAENPCAGLRSEEGKGVDRWLNDEERAILLEEVASDPDLDLLVRLGLTTGHRQGKLVTLTWSQIDRKEKLIYLGETKNGQPLVVPLEPGVERLLSERVRRIDSDYILEPTKKLGEPRFPAQRWRDIRDRCMARGVAYFRFHDLRHSCASYLAQAGFSLPQIGEFLGHKSLQATARYAHLVRRDLVEAARSALRERGIS